MIGFITRMTTSQGQHGLSIAYTATLVLSSNSVSVIFKCLFKWKYKVRPLVMSSSDWVFPIERKLNYPLFNFASVI